MTKDSCVLLLQFTLTELYFSFLAHPLVLNEPSQAAACLSRWFAVNIPHRTLAVDFHILVQRQGNIPYLLLLLLLMMAYVLLFFGYKNTCSLYIVTNCYYNYSKSMFEYFGLYHSFGVLFPSATTFPLLILKCI